MLSVQLYCVALMLSVRYKPFTLSVVMLNVFMLNVVKLNVVTLNFVMLSVLARLAK